MSAVTAPRVQYAEGVATGRRTGGARRTDGCRGSVWLARPAGACRETSTRSEQSASAAKSEEANDETTTTVQPALRGSTKAGLARFVSSVPGTPSTRDAGGSRAAAVAGPRGVVLADYAGSLDIATGVLPLDSLVCLSSNLVRVSWLE